MKILRTFILPDGLPLSVAIEFSMVMSYRASKMQECEELSIGVSTEGRFVLHNPYGPAKVWSKTALNPHLAENTLPQKHIESLLAEMPEMIESGSRSLRRFPDNTEAHYYFGKQTEWLPLQGLSTMELFQLYIKDRNPKIVSAAKLMAPFLGNDYLKLVTAVEASLELAA